MQSLIWEWFPWMILSLGILVSGIGAFYFLVKRYRSRLLFNFYEKLWMTLILGLTFAGFFIGSNYLLMKLLNREHLIEHFADYLSQLAFLIRMGLIFFILNACLILVFRSVIKRLYNMFNL